MKTWQSEYSRLLKEANERIDEQVRQQEERHKRVDTLSSWCPDFLKTIWRVMMQGFMVISTLCIYVVYIYAIFNPQVHALDDAHTFVFCYSLVMVWYCLRTTISEDFEVTKKTPIVSLPLGFVAWFIIAIITEFAAFGGLGPGIALVINLTIVALFLLCYSLNRSARKIYRKYDEIQRDLEAGLEVIKDLPNDPKGKSALQGQKCSICLQDSKYEICLSCEKQFQGERQRVRSQILRAKQHNTPATLTLVEWLDTLAIFHWRCAYCYDKYEALEHYIPVVHGGGTTKENCVPACFKCNSKKSGKHPER